MKAALSTIGITVKINNVAIWGATDYSDLGGEPDMIDATKLSDSVRVNVKGVQDQNAWTCTYQYEQDSTEGATTDYDRLKVLEDAGTKNVPVSVELPDGSIFTNSGEISTYIQGKGVNEVITAVVSVALDGKWIKSTT